MTYQVKPSIHLKEEMTYFIRRLGNFLIESEEFLFTLRDLFFLMIYTLINEEMTIKCSEKSFSIIFILKLFSSI